MPRRRKTISSDFNSKTDVEWTENQFESSSSRNEDLTRKFVNHRIQALENGVSEETIRNMFLQSADTDLPKQKVGCENVAAYPSTSTKASHLTYRNRKVRPSPAVCIGLLIGALVTVSGVLRYVYGIDKDYVLDYIHDSRCIVDNGGMVMEVSRPIVKCEVCQHLLEVPVKYKITRKSFFDNYAYSGVPVLVKNATQDWTAMDSFGFQFFKQLYTDTEGSLAAVDEECQFFPYKTEFDSLGDVFNMTQERSELKQGEAPWYVGW
jgi:hypothetical protein